MFVLMMSVGLNWFEVFVDCGVGVCYCYWFDDIVLIFDFVLCL